MPENLLFEIGCEELPAGFINPALAELESLARDGLAEARLGHGALRAAGTPRRLALLVDGLADRQEDHEREVVGPAVRVAFDASGQPTNAAGGFAKGAGVPVEALERTSTAKGEYLLARVMDRGKPAAEVLPGLLAGWAQEIHFPKTMHWGAGARFARPVRWIVALLGGSLLPLEVFGITAGRKTRGHRTIAPDWLDVARASDYSKALRDRGVILEPGGRREAIAAELERASKTLSGRPVDDPELLDEVANLVEWPEAVVGSFDAKYLKLPRAVVVTAMRSHQRYFAVESADGSLRPNFVMIRSGRGEGADQIRRGTELVLRARLEDARFYWENDLKGGLEAKVPGLKGIVWHERLGTIFDRTQRISELAQELARTLAPKSRATVARAAALCKADLASEMVRSGKEFASLQGLIGAEYAAASGEPPDVVQAIREHYRPEGPSDPIPTSVEARILALADKIEAVVGGFRAGLEVTGSQDPYGLRRAGNGIARILIEAGWRLDVLGAAKWMDGVYDKAGVAKAQGAGLHQFWAQRMESGLMERGITRETAAAVLGTRPGDPLDLLDRGRAVDQIRQSTDFEGLMIGYRRAANILKSAAAKDVAASNAPLAERAEAFAEKAEADLHLETKMARQALETYLQAPRPDYPAILRHLLGLRPSIDRFFEAVMVMVDDPSTRRRRLGLLQAVADCFLRIADFSALPSAPGQKSV